MIHTPPSVASVAAPPRGIPPLFKADTVNIAVSASKDGKLRVVYGGWDDAKVIPGGASTDPAWRPQSDRQARALPVTSGEGGSLSPHRYASREVLLDPVDET
jgi:hypothetical protein